jgi:DNA-binding beta-propeller fold protein YncE
MRPSPPLAALLFAACTGVPGADDGTPDGGTDGDVGPPCAFVARTAGVSTLAGCEHAGGSDGDRASARFSNPVNVERGPGDELYVADFDNNRIRVVDDDGNVTTLVAQEGFERPFALELVGDTLYVSTDRNDHGDHSTMTGTIWRVDVATGAAEVVIRDIGRPRGMVALPDGRLALSDYQHHAIRLLDPDTGALTNLAGAFDADGMVDARGASARFAQPYGMALAPDGRILVADFGNDRIRAVELDGDVVSFASTGLDDPEDVAVAGNGDVFVADTGSYTIRKISGGAVTTVVGSGVAGYLDSDDLLAAELHGLEGLDVSADGRTLWIADGTRGEDLPFHRVRIAELP